MSIIGIWNDLKSLLRRRIPYNPYSPDLALFDCKLFSGLLTHLDERVLTAHGIGENTLATFFTSKRKDFYKNGIIKMCMFGKKLLLMIVHM